MFLPDRHHALPCCSGCRRPLAVLMRNQQGEYYMRPCLRDITVMAGGNLRGQCKACGSTYNAFNVDVAIAQAIAAQSQAVSVQGAAL